MNTGFFALSMALFCTALSSASGVETLRLIAQDRDQQFDVTGLNERGTPLLGPDRKAASSGTTWRIEGDMRVHMQLLRSSPVYSIQRASDRARQVTPGKPWRATVQVRHAPLAQGLPPRGLQPLLADWPDGLPDGGLAVVAWLVGATPADVVVLPLPSTSKDDHYGFAAEFSLSDEQATRGRPVLLLWRDGTLIAPTPLFAQPALQAALAAIQFDDAAALGAALGKDGNLEAVSRDGYSLVHYAAGSGAAACLSRLLQLKPGLANASDKFEWTPLHHACDHGRSEAVQVLLANRAQVNVLATEGGSPILLAVQTGQPGVVKALLEKRARAYVRNRTYDLVSEAISRGYVDVADMLLAARMAFDFKSPKAGRQMLVAAVRGHLAAVQWLVTHGTDPNADINGATVLLLAARDGDEETARALIAAGSKPDAATKTGFTALMAAANVGNVRYARALLDAGCPVQAKTTEGTTALHLAAQMDSEELVNLLLGHGADLSATNQFGSTPLEVALAAGSPNSARALAQRGATINLSHPAVESHLATALRNDSIEVIEGALRDGWPAQSTLAGVWPATRVAEIFKSERCLQALLAAGAPAPSPESPMPLASVRELDQPVKIARQADLIDPRGTTEEFPETVVRVNLVIDAEGRPLFPGVTQSSDPRLASAAIESIKNFRFSAMRRGGQPVAVRVQVPMAFPASDERVFEIDRLSQLPIPTFQTPPLYPAHLKMRGITGRVEVGFIVDTTGQVRDVQVISATHPDFGAAGVEAVQKWRFKPGSIDGRPVNTRMKQPMAFTLIED